ncbi:MAG: SDR family oxidoreductase [Candidatus Nitrosopumilus sp. bin_6a]
MTILITGGTGALGSELKKIFPDSISPEHKFLDICNSKSVDDLFKKDKIDLVIHTAAFTTVRGCEDDKSRAMQVNVTGTKNLVNQLHKSNPSGKFVYISTACVFDGHSGMYDENSIPYPENFYSLTKLLGEYETKKLENFLIIRTNFVARKKWPYSKAFTDRYGTYLFANQVALGIKEVLDEAKTGTIHIVGNKKLSMFELAKITTPEIQPMTLNDYSGPSLTVDMSLDTIKWKKYDLI